jgi:DNA topoisomerase-2
MEKPEKPEKPSRKNKKISNDNDSGKSKKQSKLNDDADNDNDNDNITEIKTTKTIEPMSIDALVDKTIIDSKKYNKKQLKQHILDLPDTYIGSVEPSEIETWVVNNLSNPSDLNITPIITHKQIHVSMGLYKIVDEILQNAADNVGRTQSQGTELTTQIKVNFIDDGTIEVYNNGEGIPIIEHQEHKILIPTMIFGELMTSSNYDQSEQRLWGGRNGFGSKVACIYSKHFTVETVDHHRKKKFTQTWTDNMTVAGTAKVVDVKDIKPFTRITFLPDYKRFGCENLEPDMKSLLYRRVYDLAATSGANVWLNGKKLPIKHFQHFTELFLDKNTKRVYECIYYEKSSKISSLLQSPPPPPPPPSQTPPQPFLPSKISPPSIAWEIVICPSPDGTFKHVSYVNNVSTFKGGKHVEYIGDKISKVLCDQYNHHLAKNQTPIQKKHIKNNMWVFVNCFIINPTFDSQTKEYLSTPSSHFPNLLLSDTFYTKLSKTDIMDRAKLLKDFQEQKTLVKTDGKKVKTINGIPKLDDANYAGGVKSSKCTLIVCEGDSARAFVMSGLGIIGRDYYGVFPLRGKVLNVRDVSTKQLSENKEIIELKKILGLQDGIKNIGDLRYGKLMILTDEDVDGLHIKALIMNLFDVMWKDIIKQGFVVSMYTPLIKVRRGKNIIKSFFTEGEYKEWVKSGGENNQTNLSVRYYKGLGTHTAEEARDYFKTLQQIDYVYDDKAEEMLSIVFDKKMAYKRKEWISNHTGDLLDYKKKNLNISEFLDKGLILFSNEDNIRSIPSLIDGLKPSQRKVLCGMMKKNQTHEIKVSQIVGPISSDMCYHHGEVSLANTIIGMAQNFVGSNNINLIHPEGQFGTRLKGGDDAASSRYIFTYLEPITRKIFRIEDDPILISQKEEGFQIEPKFYIPIIPMVLVNGTSGIGTGFSTSIPNFNPIDIIENIKKFLNNQPLSPLVPWYRKFSGKIVEEDGGGVFASKGIWNVQGKKIYITELPLGIWTDNYKIYLEKIIENQEDTSNKLKVVRFKTENKQDDRFVNLTIELNQTSTDMEQVETLLKLSENKMCGMSNMHVFDPHGHLAKFKHPNDILQTFCRYRLHYYDCRKKYQLQLLDRNIIELKEKIRFINMVSLGKITVINCPKLQLCQQLETENFTPNPHLIPIIKEYVSVQEWIEASENYVIKDSLYSRKYDSKEDDDGSSYNNNNNNDDDDDDDDDDDNDTPNQLQKKYKYLTNIPIYNTTKEEIDKLNKQLQLKEKNRMDIFSKSIKDMWLDDLKELEKELIVHNKVN